MYVKMFFYSKEHCFLSLYQRKKNENEDFSVCVFVFHICICSLDLGSFIMLDSYDQDILIILGINIIIIWRICQ